MNRTRSLILIGTLAVVLGMGGVFAHQTAGDIGRRGPGRGGFAMRDAGIPLRAVNLTAAQRQQIQTLTDGHREQSRPAAERLRAALDAERAAVRALPVDEQAIRASTVAAANARADVAIAQARLRASIFALLTPEQQAEAAKIRSEGAGRGPGVRPGRGRPGRGH
jgi:protein CpxP